MVNRPPAWRLGQRPSTLHVATRSVSPGRPPQPPAFTLLEMLVVLVILTLLLGFAWPSLRKLAARNELKSAAKTLRTELAKARLLAIETGTAQVFRFRPGTGQFEVLPKQTVLPESAGSDEVESLAAQADQQTAAGARRPPAPQQLPGRVRFAAAKVTAQTAVEEQEADAAGTLGALLDESAAALSTEDAWSRPIVFYPNGRAASALIRLTRDRQYTIDVSLRGLTGSVSIGRLQAIESSPQSPLSTAPPATPSRSKSLPEAKP